MKEHFHIQFKVFLKNKICYLQDDGINKMVLIREVTKIFGEKKDSD